MHYIEDSDVLDGEVTSTRSDSFMYVKVPRIRLTYLKKIMRSDSFETLWKLFKHANDPAKELTESYAALHHLRHWQNVLNVTVLHVGDGAHCRTGAMFALMTKHNNVSIDPIADKSGIATEWGKQYNIQRFGWATEKIEDWVARCIEAPTFHWGPKFLVTFVHAHVDVDAVLKRLGNRWIAAYTNACCQPQRQLGTVGETRTDWAILSPERRYKVLTPHDYADACACHHFPCICPSVFVPDRD